MIFILDKNGNVISSDTSDTLVQYSVNANELKVKFEEINVEDYVAYVAFERADGKVSPLIALSYGAEYLTYHFSDAWVTAISGLLKISITLKQNNIVKKTANFNLNVTESIQEDEVNYIDDVAYNELALRLANAEKEINKKLDKSGGELTGAISVVYEDGNKVFIGMDDGEQLTVETPKVTTHNIDARNEKNESFVIDGGYGEFEIDFANEEVKIKGKKLATEGYVDSKIPTKLSQLEADVDFGVKEEDLDQYLIDKGLYTYEKKTIDYTSSIEGSPDFEGYYWGAEKTYNLFKGDVTDSTIRILTTSDDAGGNDKIVINFDNTSGALTVRCATQIPYGYIHQSIFYERGLLNNIIEQTENALKKYVSNYTYSKNEINDRLSAIPKFSIQVVTKLENLYKPNSTTVYLVPKENGTNDLYEEWIYINDTWELLGTAKVDLSEYALKTEIPTKLSELEQDVELGVSEEDVMNVLEENSAETETLNIGTSDNYDVESDSEVPTTKTVKKIIDSENKAKLVVSGTHLLTSDENGSTSFKIGVLNEQIKNRSIYLIEVENYDAGTILSGIMFFDTNSRLLTFDIDSDQPIYLDFSVIDEDGKTFVRLSIMDTSYNDIWEDNTIEYRVYELPITLEV